MTTKLLKSNPSEHTHALTTYSHKFTMSMPQTVLPPTTIFFADHTDFEMAEAAEQLMQLSDEDYRSNSISGSVNNDYNNTKNLEATSENDLFGGVCCQEEITSRKIEEIFGRDDAEEIERRQPERKRKYRPIVAIYRDTSPAVNVKHEMKKKKKKVRY